MINIDSYPTDPASIGLEIMSPGFSKLHGANGSPIHIFSACEDTEFHDHPFFFKTSIVAGGYRELVLLQDENGDWVEKLFTRLPGTSHDMPIGVPHMLVELIDGTCVTRCEYGPTVQKPGFCKFIDGVLMHRYHDQKQESDWKVYDPYAGVKDFIAAEQLKLDRTDEWEDDIITAKYQLGLSNNIKTARSYLPK